MNKEQAIKLFEGLIKDWEQAKNVCELGDTGYYTSQALISAYNIAISVLKVMEMEEPKPEKVEARLAEHWHEDIGPVLWWNFPVEEPPYCGTPLDEDFPKYKTHFTTIDMPTEIEQPKRWVVKFEQENEHFYFVGWMHMHFTHPIGYGKKEADDVIKFTNLKKAEAVAILIDGSVEEE